MMVFSKYEALFISWHFFEITGNESYFDVLLLWPTTNGEKLHEDKA